MGDLEKNPWKTIAAKTVYENNWIEVVHKDVIIPNGKAGIYGQVNFKNVAIGVIPLDQEGNTWIVGQYRFPLEEYSWEIPEGGCPEGEEYLAAAQRELKEETGLVAQKYTLVSKIHTSNSVCREVAYIYLAEDLSFTQAEPEETEVLQIKKLPFSEALSMVMENKITDSMSVAGIMKVARLRGF